MGFLGVGARAVGPDVGEQASGFPLPITDFLLALGQNLGLEGATEGGRGLDCRELDLRVVMPESRLGGALVGRRPSLLSTSCHRSARSGRLRLR